MSVDGWKDRLQIEYDALDDRMGRLSQFIAGDKFKLLDGSDGFLLRRQLDAMAAYAGILIERIERAK